MGYNLNVYKICGWGPYVLSFVFLIQMQSCRYLVVLLIIYISQEKEQSCNTLLKSQDDEKSTTIEIIVYRKLTNLNEVEIVIHLQS